jgi:hypothetical protein
MAAPLDEITNPRDYSQCYHERVIGDRPDALRREHERLIAESAELKERHGALEAASFDHLEHSAHIKRLHAHLEALHLYLASLL